MKPQLIFSPYLKSVVAIFVACVLLWFFPSPAFDACFPNKGGQYGCGVLPDFLAGFIFLLVCFFAGPTKKWHYVIVVLLFSFLGIAELIRFGSLEELLFYAPYQEFYYGGLLAMALYFGARYLRYKWQCT